jgi:hypothetical protein
MRYRIEISSSRSGFARVNLPGRIIEIEALDHMGPVWQVKLSDAVEGSSSPIVGPGPGTVRADNANDAVWRVARAAVRAVSELTGSPIEGELTAGSEPSSDN